MSICWIKYLVCQSFHSYIILYFRVIKGKPEPKITWLYKSDNSYDFEYVPNGVSSDGGILKIDSAQLDHRGLYKCEASNFIGEDFREVSIKVECM